MFSIIKDKKLLLYLLITFIVSFIFFSFLQNRNSLADPDSYYHAKITRMMIDKGLVFKKFPSLNATILRDNFVDYHWLYHASLIPFVSFFGDLTGVRIGTIFLTALFIAVFYFILHTNRIRFPGFYLFLLISVPTFILRLSIVKANAVSLCFLFLGINLMLKKKRWQLLLLSMIYVWFYGGFIMLTGTSLVYIISMGIKNTVDNSKEILKPKIIYWRAIKYFFRGLFLPDGWKSLLMVLSGNLLGMVINPYAGANFKFYWVQIYKIAMVGSPAGFDLGRGWYPVSGQVLLNETMVILIVFIILIALLMILKVKANLEFIFFSSLSIAFLIMSRRSIRMFEYSAPVIAWFLAAGFKLLFQSVTKEQFIERTIKIFRPKIVPITLAAIIISISGFFIFTGIRDVKKMLYNHPLHHLKGPAAWLKNNTPSQSVVFNAGWDDWPFLFYFNDHNNYLVGLDPLFMYEHDAKKYRLWYRIINGRVKTNLAADIINNFNAKFVVLSRKRKFSRFIRILDNTEKITRVFEDNSGFVYKLE